jgi:aspartate aminotransferase-like enzyme
MTPATPAVGVLFAVQEGLRMLEAEGLESAYARHRRVAEATGAGLEALGFKLFAAPGYRSPTVTAALPPPGVEVAALRELLRQRYGVVIVGGPGKMSGKMVRIGHLGAVAEGDLVQVLWALEQALEELGVAPAEGRAVRAAGAVLGRQAVAAG